MLHEPAVPPRKRVALGVLVCMVLGVGATVALRRLTVIKPNVVLLTVDTLRADRLGCYGASTPRTPQIDRLATEGALFENAGCAVPMTRPSVFSILTSRHPREHGVLNNWTALPDRGAVLPEVFRQAGYRTAAFVGVQLFAPESGAARGFDTFQTPEQAREEPAGALVPRAIEWLWATAERKPFFLWIHLFDPHLPYGPPVPGQAEVVDPDRGVSWPYLVGVADENSGDIPRQVYQRALALYGGEIEYVDRWVGELISALVALEVFDQTIVAFTADHGECFDHGIFFEHSDCPYQGAIRVPLLLRYPRMIPGGRRVRGLVEHVDLPPTLLALAGIPVPAHFRGRPLTLTLGDEADRRAAEEPREGESDERFSLIQLPLYPERAIQPRSRRHERIRSVVGQPTRPILVEREGVGLRSRTWKYIAVGSSEELYDLRADPQEQQDVSLGRPDVLARMRVKLHEELQAHPLDLPAPGVINQRLRDTLRALGYLQ